MFEPDLKFLQITVQATFPRQRRGPVKALSPVLNPTSSCNDISCWAQDKSGYCWSVNHFSASALAVPGHEEAVAYGDSPASYIAHQSSVRTSAPTALVWIPDLFSHTFIAGPMTFLLKIVIFTVKVL